MNEFLLGILTFCAIALPPTAANLTRHKLYSQPIDNPSYAMAYFADPVSNMAFYPVYYCPRQVPTDVDIETIILTAGWVDCPSDLYAGIDSIYQLSSPRKRFFIYLQVETVREYQKIFGYKYRLHEHTPWNFIGIPVAQGPTGSQNYITDGYTPEFLKGVKHLVLMFDEIYETKNPGRYTIESIEKLYKQVERFQQPDRVVYIGFNAYFLSLVPVADFKKIPGVGYLIYWFFPFKYPDMVNLKAIVEIIRADDTKVEWIMDQAVALQLSSELPKVYWTAVPFPTFRDSLQNLHQLQTFKWGLQKMIYLRVKTCDKSLLISEKCSSRTPMHLEWVLDDWTEVPTFRFYPFVMLDEVTDKAYLPLSFFPYDTYIVILVAAGTNGRRSANSVPDFEPLPREKYVVAFDEGRGKEPYTAQQIQLITQSVPRALVDRGDNGIRLDFLRLKATPKGKIEEIFNCVLKSSYFKYLVLYSMTDASADEGDEPQAGKTNKGRFEKVPSENSTIEEIEEEKEEEEKEMSGKPVPILREIVQYLNLETFLFMSHKDASELFGDRDGGLPDFEFQHTMSTFIFTAAENQTFPHDSKRGTGTRLAPNCILCYYYLSISFGFLANVRTFFN